VLGLAVYFLYGRRQSRLAVKRQPTC